MNSTGDTMMKSLQHLGAFLFSKNLTSIEIFLLAACLFSVYMNNIVSVEFQPDETFWIVSSVRFDAFASGEFNSPIWIKEPFISFEVRPIPSYIVAISQRLGDVQPNHLPAYWDWSLTENDNLARGAMPSARLLWLSRLPMALISVFSLLGVALLLIVSHSRITAYVFTLLSFNGYFLLHLRRAMSEAPLLLFTVLVLYASYGLVSVIQEKPPKKIVFWSILVGVLSGLAGQSKLTGLACVAIPILGTLILVSRSRDYSMQLKGRIFLSVTLLSVCASLLVFLISYPFFYENTLHRILTTFYMRGQVVDAQINAYPEQTIKPNERLPLLFERIFEYPLNFPTRGMISTLLHWANFSLAAFGLIYSMKQIWIKRYHGDIHLLLVLTTLFCAIPMLFVPLDWDRYYLYPIFFSCVFVAIGISQLLSLGYSKFRERVQVSLVVEN